MATNATIETTSCICCESDAPDEGQPGSHENIPAAKSPEPKIPTKTEPALALFPAPRALAKPSEKATTNKPVNRKFVFIIHAFEPTPSSLM